MVRSTPAGTNLTNTPSRRIDTTGFSLSPGHSRDRFLSEPASRVSAGMHRGTPDRQPRWLVTSRLGVWGEKVLKRKSALLVAAVLASIVSPGCASSAAWRSGSIAATPPARQSRSIAATSILFNPKRNSSPGYFREASRWPSTPVFADQREEVWYRETVYDRQGQSGSAPDLYYRRFYSTRIGQARR